MMLETRTTATNPRAQRSVNTHEFVFEDTDFSSDTGTYEIFNTEIHDHETPILQLNFS
jgi:hypothetical protein